MNNKSGNTKLNGTKYEIDYFKVFLAIVALLLFIMLIYYIVNRKPAKVIITPPPSVPQQEEKRQQPPKVGKPNDPRGEIYSIIKNEDGHGYMTPTLLKNLTDFEDNFYYDNCKAQI